MAQIVNISSFAGTNGQSISAADANWVEHLAYAAGNLLVSNGRVRQGNTDTPGVFYRSEVPASRNQVVSSAVYAPGGLGAIGARLVARMDPASDTYIGGGYVSGVVTVFKMVNGTLTTLGSSVTVTPPSVGTSKTLSLSVSGVAPNIVVTLSYDGVQRISQTVTDAMLDAVGRVGIRMTGGGSSDTNGPQLTSFLATDDTAADTTAPTWTGPITVGVKTSSTINLTLPTAADDVAVTGYQYRVNGGSWIDNGASTSVAISGLTPLTSYTIDARAYDTIPNYSSTLSVTTSTYRAGALGSTILLTTGPVDSNPAGILYNDVEIGDEGKWFSFYIVTAPASGTLEIDPDGTFTFTGPDATTFTYQLEVDGVEVGSPTLVTLYTSSGGGDGGTMIKQQLSIKIGISL